MLCMDFDSYARRLWTGRADAYERGFARLTVHAVGALLDAAGVGTGTEGAGRRHRTRAWWPRSRWRAGAQVTAVDAEPSMAEAAARNVPGLDVRVAVLPDLPLPDAGFDAVTGNFVIHATPVIRPPCWRSSGACCARAAGSRSPAGASRRPRCSASPGRPSMRPGVPWPPDIPVPPFRPYSSPGAFAALLADVGFTETAAQVLTWEHRVDPREWWEVYRSSVGSSGAVIARQDDATIERIKDEFDSLVARYATGDGVVVLPASAVLASGTRP